MKTFNKIMLLGALAIFTGVSSIKCAAPAPAPVPAAPAAIPAVEYALKRLAEPNTVYEDVVTNDGKITLENDTVVQLTEENQAAIHQLQDDQTLDRLAKPTSKWWNGYTKTGAAVLAVAAIAAGIYATGAIDKVQAWRANGQDADTCQPGQENICLLGDKEFEPTGLNSSGATDLDSSYEPDTKTRKFIKKITSDPEVQPEAGFWSMDGWNKGFLTKYIFGNNQ
jgi:hypothetical protein